MEASRGAGTEGLPLGCTGCTSSFWWMADAVRSTSWAWMAEGAMAKDGSKVLFLVFLGEVVGLGARESAASGEGDVAGEFSRAQHNGFIWRAEEKNKAQKKRKQPNFIAGGVSHLHRPSRARGRGQVTRTGTSRARVYVDIPPLPTPGSAPAVWTLPWTPEIRMVCPTILDPPTIRPSVQVLAARFHSSRRVRGFADRFCPSMDR